MGEAVRVSGLGRAKDSDLPVTGSMRVAQFDLRLTLESGQCFRYTEADGAFLLITRGYAIRLRQQRAILRYAGAPRQVVEHVLGLTSEHGRCLARLEQDEVIAPFARAYGGMRLMRMDAYETILGFICSANSNIPRIRSNLDMIAWLFGEHADGVDHLPREGMALDESALARIVKAGYRAPYLARTSKAITPAFLERLASLPYEDAHALLMTLPGIGPKVADCICLYALGHGDAFPVDVHVHRAMRTLFPRARLTTPSKAKRFAIRRWGEDAGHAQQLLFQYARDTLGARPLVPDRVLAEGGD